MQHLKQLKWQHWLLIAGLLLAVGVAAAINPWLAAMLLSWVVVAVVARQLNARDCRGARVLLWVAIVAGTATFAVGVASTPTAGQHPAVHNPTNQAQLSK